MTISIIGASSPGRLASNYKLINKLKLANMQVSTNIQTERERGRRVTRELEVHRTYLLAYNVHMLIILVSV